MSRSCRMGREKSSAASTKESGYYNNEHDLSQTPDPKYILAYMRARDVPIMINVDVGG